MKNIILTLTLLVAAIFTAHAEDPDSLYATRLLKPGQEAPAFTLTTQDGVRKQLADWRGQFVVLDFWASWCPDCRKDIPAMRALWQQYGEKVAFVSVSFDTDAKRWTDCIEQNGMGWTHVSELKKWKETQVSKDYHVDWIPTMYVIDPEGRVMLGTVVIDKVSETLDRVAR